MASFHLEIASQYLEFNGKVKYSFTIIIKKKQQYAVASRVFFLLWKWSCKRKRIWRVMRVRREERGPERGFVWEPSPPSGKQSSTVVQSSSYCVWITDSLVAVFRCFCRVFLLGMVMYMLMKLTQKNKSYLR